MTKYLGGPHGKRPHSQRIFKLLAKLSLSGNKIGEPDPPSHFTIVYWPCDAGTL